MRGSSVSKISGCLSAFAIVFGTNAAFAQDADGDGVADAIDGAPCDASVDGVAYAPAEGQSMMLAWEDLWPALGDADFNDLVFSVNYAFRTKGSLVRSVRLSLGVLAVGSDYDNGVGLHLPVSRDLVSSVTRTVNGAGATALVLEPDTELTTIVSANLRDHFGGQAGPINSTGPSTPAVSIEVEIVFTQPVALSIGAAPFDLFLVRSWDRGHEIHTTGYAGTLSMNQALFGTGDDGSTASRKFVDTRGVPFVLVLPEVTAWPVEQGDVTALFLDLLAFAASGGATNKDFYLTNVHPAAAYPSPPSVPVISAAVDSACLVGQTPEAAGRSCFTIHTELGGNVADGPFWIDPDGVGFGESAFQVWCDMSGGGWSVLQHDTYAFARQARGVPSAQPGWGVDYSSASSPIRDARLAAFKFEVENGPGRTFDDVKRFGASTRPTVYELFGGAHPNSWGCDSDNPSAATCHFTTGDGRSWGVWESTSRCCIGDGTGGFWYYSKSAAGSENFGLCGDGYPNGAGYTGSNTGCSGAGYYTPVSPSGSQTFKISVRFYVPPTPDGATCRTILDDGDARGDGVYVIDPDGPYGAEPVEVYCDMSTDGGGWIVLHDDAYAYARSARGAPSAGTGWSVDYLGASSPLRDLPIEDFIFEVPGAYTKAFSDVTAYSSQARLTPPDLFGGAHSQNWRCDSDNPGAGGCAFSTGDGRHWGLWESTSGCCIGANTGGFWFYSMSGGGTENYGVCSEGYPNGAAYSGAQSGCDGGGYYTPVTPSGSQRFVLKVREPARRPALNTPATARASCRQILDLGESQGDGVYWIDGPTGPMRAACDMVTDGGGWTTFFAGRNGAPNVFDHFDAGYYAGRCYDAEQSCLRYMPTSNAVGDTEIAVVHGASVVAFDLTAATEAYFERGAQAAWVPVVGRSVGAGPVRAGVDMFWTGSGANTGFIAGIGQNQTTTFASAYDYGTSWDVGNGVPDVSTPIRLMYREGGRPASAVLNTQGAARTSCRAILDSGESAGSGLYWLTDSGAAYLAYCDMVTDGGGWTVFVAGYNGASNTFDHMEAGYHTGICEDPEHRCMRRLPTSVPTAGMELAVAVDDAVVAWPMTSALYAWASAGTQGGWVSNLVPTALSGGVVVLPNSMWTGQGANTSWIAARAQTSGASVFAAQYDYNTGWNYANGGANVWSSVRLMFREGGVPADPTAFASCRAALAAGQTADGVYRLQRPGGRVVEAYCDQTTDGGGWQAIFSGANGRANVFDGFEAAYHVGTCADPATRCLRRLPADVNTATLEMAVACGDAMVAFTPSAGVINLFAHGLQGNWQSITNVRDIGRTPVAYVPNMVWTGSGTNRAFIVSRDNTAAHTFGSSYPVNDSWSYCNGVADASSPLLVYFRE